MAWGRLAWNGEGKGAQHGKPPCPRRLRPPSEPARLGDGTGPIGHRRRVTVNFENAGKRLVNAAVVELEEIEPDDADA